ncbi:MAG: hypothetical protein MJE66_04115 [Proteobacteria bacterium]|nr:hypothetical protein [Pseudomonadota bacterium]
MRSGRPSSPATASLLRTRCVVALLFAAQTAACAHAPVDEPPRVFDFERDTFAFVNELYWDYTVDASGQQTGRAREEEVLFGQRCASMARAARQFFHAAAFVPDAPPLSDAEHRERIARVMASDPRRERPARTRVVIPGHTDLRAFSRVQERALKEALGGSWKSYLQRGNWRMIFPFSPAHQRNTAGNLVASLEAGHPPIVHLVQFPNVTVNHSVLVISAEESPTEIVFRTYDSNVADGVRVLRYDRVERHFTFPTTTYFAGGRVDVYEIYDGWLF